MAGRHEPAPLSGAERIEVVDSPAAVEADAWDALVAAADPGPEGANPCVRHAFFSALLDSGCASPRAGWRARFLVLRRAGALAGILPLFEKTHSYGEYVFDWAWAEAYARHGLEYYPKLLGAVPFTPVGGPRVLAATDADRDALIAAALGQARGYSSLHILFPTAAEAARLAAAGMMLRRTVQFHWTNAGDRDFEAFLARMTHRRRKVIRQERRRVRDAGIVCRRLRGPQIAEAQWRFFDRCYQNTYAAHGSSPYLNLEFFLRLGAGLREHTVMVLAERDGRPVAASLLLEGGDALYGRYWGAIEHVPLLHFECCYYQAIEHAIERGLARFEGGAQGEHKLFRGLMPVETLSAHWLAHPAFASAVDDYLAREAKGIARYVDELERHTPFARTRAAD